MRKKQEKRGFLKDNYSLSWNYVKESVSYFLFVTMLLLLGVFVALIYHPPELVDSVREFMEKIITETSELNTAELSIYILNNNLKNSFFAMSSGIILGIVPALTALSNGYVLGFVSALGVSVAGPSILFRLVPHGIFEFPAIILALGTGTKLGMFWFGKNKKQELLRRVEGSLRVFLFFILPLLVIAAIVEGILITLVS